MDFQVPMRPQPNLLVLDAAPARTLTIRNRLRENGLCASCLDLDHPFDAGGALTAADLVLISVDREGRDEHGERLNEVLGELARAGIPTLAWGLSECGPAAPGAPVEYLSAGVSLDEVVGRLTAMARYAPLIRRLDGELQHMQRIAQQVQRYFAEIDKEMRLAGRLQRNFLPQALPQLPRLRSACLYRPATWVSGDVYDVYQVDAAHVGVFIADAMGHGTAAALMTMFLRQALHAHRVVGRNRQLVAPATVMEKLNRCLVDLRLPDSQFVTAAYGVVNTKNLELRLARGGHPYALHIDGAGRIRELVQAGDLLGLTELAAEFAETRVQLAPGDRLLLYSDGIEASLIAARSPDGARAEFTPYLRDWARLGAEALVEAIGGFLDRQEGSLHPSDDVTVIALEVTG